MEFSNWESVEKRNESKKTFSVGDFLKSFLAEKPHP